MVDDINDNFDIVNFNRADENLKDKIIKEGFKL